MNLPQEYCLVALDVFRKFPYTKDKNEQTTRLALPVTNNLADAEKKWVEIIMAEEWAKAYGYRQIRAWSSDDKTEAIPMWYALGYGVCPAIMRGESVIKEFAGKPIYGFYVSKVL